MTGLARFGVSVEGDLLKRFDAVIRGRKYAARSKAIEDLIRQAISSQELTADKSEVLGSINIVYDHHKRELLNKLTDIQHDHQQLILSSQHIHIDHHNCFEIIIVKGKKHLAEKLANLIKSAKGVKHCSLQLVSVNKS